MSGAWQAIGLVRTEFLLPDAGVMPDRAFYAEAFEAVLEAAYPLPVTFRLLDLAADKHPSWASALPDTGPLGLHGSRLYRHPRGAGRSGGTAPGARAPEPAF